MSTRPVTIDRFAGPLRPRAAEQLCAAVILASVVFLAAALLNGVWLIDARGFAIPTDFLNVWAAGRLTLDGHAAAAYDWDLHKQAQVAALGHSFAYYGCWFYPPPFLFVSAALAKLPYFVAFATWMAMTWSLFALTLRRIVDQRLGLLVAAAFPAAVFNLAVGQNGFLTAALVGAALLLLEKRPVLAGICAGLISYKPQFGLLFPLVLAAAGYWRTFATAAIVSVALALASWLAFGNETWAAFFAASPLNAKAVLSDGRLGFVKLQSMFGLVRALGGGETVAWSLQIATASASALGVAVLWWRPLPFELKAAAFAVGTLLITPYVFVYDLTVLAVATVFLVRLGLRTGFLPHEVAALIAAAFCILLYPVAAMPTGLSAVLTCAALIGVRAHAQGCAAKQRRNTSAFSACGRAG